MKKKIRLTEAQFREFMRTKLHENKQESGKKIRLTEEQMRFIIGHNLKEGVECNSLEMCPRTYEGSPDFNEPLADGFYIGEDVIEYDGYTDVFTSIYSREETIDLLRTAQDAYAIGPFQTEEAAQEYICAQDSTKVNDQHLNEGTYSRERATGQIPPEADKLGICDGVVDLWGEEHCRCDLFIVFDKSIPNFSNRLDAIVLVDKSENWPYERIEKLPYEKYWHVHGTITDYGEKILHLHLG